MTTFGVDLSQHLAETNKMVPPLLVKCITEIDNRGIQIKVRLKRNTFDKSDSNGFHSLLLIAGFVSSVGRQIQSGENVPVI